MRFLKPVAFFCIFLIALVAIPKQTGTYGETETELKTEIETELKVSELELEIEPKLESESVPLPVPNLPNLQVSRIYPNEVGHIMILMYHGLHETNPGPYDRLTDDFRQDLETLYNQGYRLTSLSDIIHNNISVPAGKSPVAITFDDGLSSAFSLIETDGVLSPRPGTAVYIMMEFAEAHPDFGLTAAFFVNSAPEPFSGAGTMQERFAFLIENGFEIGSHTISHPNMTRLGVAAIRREVGGQYAYLKARLPNYYEPEFFAYPYGSIPSSGSRDLILEGEYLGEEYRHSAAFRVGNTNVPPLPHHVNYNPLHVSRVNATDESTSQRVVPDMGHFFRLYANNPGLRYISDGNSNSITVSHNRAHEVNREALGEMSFFIYYSLIE